VATAPAPNPLRRQQLRRRRKSRDLFLPAAREDRERAQGDKVVDISRGARPAAGPAPDATSAPVAPGGPSVRRMARALGVEFDERCQARATAAESRPTTSRPHAKRLITAAVSSAGAGGAAPRPAAEPLLRLQPVGRHRASADERHPPQDGRTSGRVVAVRDFRSSRSTDLPHNGLRRNIRKRYAKQVGESGRAAHGDDAGGQDSSLPALKCFPRFNVSIDMAADEIIVKKYIHNRRGG